MHLLYKRSSAILACYVFIHGGSVHGGVDFKTEILPVLEAKCVKCHRAAHEENGTIIKPKKDLRLDAAWAILKGGETKDHPVLVPRDSAKSYIYEVVTLPKDDDMFMPTKGEPLTQAEVARLKTWIDEGADFGGWEGNLTGKPAPSAAGDVTKPALKLHGHDDLYGPLAEGLQPATPEALKAATATGAQVTALTPGSPLLRVDFLTSVSKCDDKSLSALDVIKANIVHLDLARTSITDVGLRQVGQFPRLVRLDLRNTKISDKGVEALALAGRLNYLNLYGTEVTDSGLATLAPIKTLRKVFLYSTKVTEAGVAKLKAALPEAEVVSDVAMPEVKPGGGSEGPKGKKKK